MSITRRSYCTGQARVKANVDKRTDLWAFGVVPYEMVTGKRLFSVRIVCSDHIIFSTMSGAARYAARFSTKPPGTGAI